MAYDPTNARHLKVQSPLHLFVLIGMALLTFYLAAWGWSQGTPTAPTAPPSPVESQKASPRPASQGDLSTLLLAMVLGMSVLNTLIILFLALGLNKQAKALEGEVKRVLRDLQGRLAEMETQVRAIPFQVSEGFAALSVLVRTTAKSLGNGMLTAPSPARVPSLESPSLETPDKTVAGEKEASLGAPTFEDLPTEPPAQSALERLLQSELAPAEFKAELQKIADDETALEQAAARVMLHWWVWLEEKREALQGLRGEDLLNKLSAWRGALDYYLWADPREAILPALAEASLPKEAVGSFLDHLQNAQKTLRQFLSEQGIERIDAPAGSEFIPGVIERSNKPPELTDDPSLCDRVCQIEPGEGGYRARGRVLMPSYARRYELHP